MDNEQECVFGQEEHDLLFAWLRNPGRKAAMRAFPLGALRSAAYAVERSGVFGPAPFGGTVVLEEGMSQKDIADFKKAWEEAPAGSWVKMTAKRVVWKDAAFTD